MGELWNMLRVTLFGSRNKERGAATFETARDIPSLAGKVVLITGAAGDIGRVSATELARYGRPARIYVADLPPRDGATKKEIVDRITRDAYGESKVERDDDKTKTEIRFLDLDLGSFESIRQCAANFSAQEERLDILIMNAGIIRVAKGVTKEGHESHFGINYLGHALLVKLLMPTMVRTAEQQQAEGGHGHGRLVIVSSEGHKMAPKEGIAFDKLKTDCAAMVGPPPSPKYMHKCLPRVSNRGSYSHTQPHSQSYTQRYGQSKLALIHLTRQLAQMYPQIEVVAVHPGRVNTGMGVSLGKESLLIRLAKPIAPLMCVTPSEGARNHLWAATSPNVVSGTYYEPVGVPDREGKMAWDNQLREKVWEWTENELRGVSALE